MVYESSNLLFELCASVFVAGEEVEACATG